MKHLDQIITQALKEDFAHADITTNLLIAQNSQSEAKIIFKETAILCGIDLVKKVFLKNSRTIKFPHALKDGTKVKKGTSVLTVRGKTKEILTAERTALNFLSHLSGISTLTHEFVTKIHPLKAKICDTRKTTPGLRDLEKYAVFCGKGHNHRRDLRDFVLVKDNHILANTQFNSLEALIQHLRKKTKKTIEIEVDNLVQLKDVLKEPPDIVLLDNMNKTQLLKAIKIRSQSKKAQKTLFEASGGITLKNVRSIAQTGVDRISIGALTHSAQAVDVSLEVTIL